ncbi:MAG: 6-carboxytetrahydropterin synthase [Chitinophagaceae bacterium]|nr:6-carboxytetrahydropterin synthase [Chitinophagaceae bacterium]
MVYLTRIEHFNAAHKLFNPDWSKEKNEAIFGGCANENWHGHNYELWVTIKGKPDASTGYSIDARVLSKLVKEVVLDKVDHHNLNIDVDFMKGKMTTVENLAMSIWEQLRGGLPSGVSLHRIRLYETPRIFVEYFGE